MLNNDQIQNDVKVMALGFSYTDEIDENFEVSTDEDDFESVSDDALSKFDDDFSETLDESIDEDDMTVSYDSEVSDISAEYDDEITEDYSDSDL